MKTLNFPGTNTRFEDFETDTPPFYNALYAEVWNDERRTAVTLWKLTFWERVVVLFTGRVWERRHVLNGVYQASCLQVTRPKFMEIFTK